MSSSSLTTKTLSKMAVCVAIICISAYISFPSTAVPFTCLTLAMLLSAFLSTPKETLIIMIVYTLIGAIGLPVFSGGAGGFNCLFSPTGGYLWGFIVSYPIASYLKGNKNSFKNFFLAGLAVIPITYIFGVAMLCFIMKLSILEGITIGALPFIPGDIIKTLIASYVAVRLRKNLFY